MNCFNHPETPSVGVCQDCQKGLCIECISKYNIPICTGCRAHRINSEKKSIKKDLFKIFGVGIAITYFFSGFLFLTLNSSKESQMSGIEIVFFVIFIIYMFSGTYVGWKKLTSFSSTVFLSLPIIGWVMFFVIKLMFSTMIGVFILPTTVLQKIKRLNQLKKM